MLKHYRTLIVTRVRLTPLISPPLIKSPNCIPHPRSPTHPFCFNSRERFISNPRSRILSEIRFEKKILFQLKFEIIQS